MSFIKHFSHEDDGLYKGLMKKKKLLDKIEDALVEEYGDTLREYGTSKKMAKAALKAGNDDTMKCGCFFYQRT